MYDNDKERVGHDATDFALCITPVNTSLPSFCEIASLICCGVNDNCPILSTSNCFMLISIIVAS